MCLWWCQTPTLCAIPGVCDCLVHWDLPQASKKISSVRFLFIKNALEFIPERGQRRHAEVHRLLGQKDQHCFVTLLPLLRRCGAVVPTSVVELVDGGKLGLGKLCERMVEGRMDCSPQCGKRHWLDRSLDQRMKMRLEGVIEFLVLSVETPVLYWVRVRNSILDMEFQRMVLRMGRHFCREGSCVPIPSAEVVVGSVLAVEGECGVYHRARVDRLEYNEDKLVKVKVFLVDDGFADTLVEL